MEDKFIKFVFMLRVLEESQTAGWCFIMTFYHLSYVNLQFTFFKAFDKLMLYVVTYSNMCHIFPTLKLEV